MKTLSRKAMLYKYFSQQHVITSTCFSLLKFDFNKFSSHFTSLTGIRPKCWNFCLGTHERIKFYINFNLQMCQTFTLSIFTLFSLFSFTICNFLGGEEKLPSIPGITGHSLISSLTNPLPPPWHYRFIRFNLLKFGLQVE